MFIRGGSANTHGGEQKEKQYKVLTLRRRLYFTHINEILYILFTKIQSIVTSEQVNIGLIRSENVLDRSVARKTNLPD